MADEEQWVAVFSDIPGNNLDEFVRCVCIEGPEQFKKNLSDENREICNSKYSHTLVVNDQIRRAYLVNSDLFEIAMGQYRMYIAQCAEEPEVMPKYVRENMKDGNIDTLVERDLVFRASMSDFEEVKREAAKLTSTHVRVVIEEFKNDSEKDVLKEVLSRAYEKDLLAFTLEKGDVILKECSFFPFEAAYYKNEQFGNWVREVILWAILSQNVNTDLWLHFTKQPPYYTTTIQLFINTVNQHLDKFDPTIYEWMMKGVDVNGIDLQVVPSIEELIADCSSKEDVVVPRNVVDRVVVKGARQPHFIPSNCNGKQDEQPQ